MSQAHNRINVINRKFGRLKVKKYAFTKNKRSYWSCECICGNITIVQTYRLISNKTKSCGCLWRESISTHKESKTLFYRRWHTVKSRALNDPIYESWGICKRWLIYLNFKKDMYKSYLNHVKKYGVKQTTIDRINGNKGYSKNNCRWATYVKQNNNLRRNHIIIYNGKKYTVSDLYKKLSPKVNRGCFYRRVIKYKWPIEKALEDFVYKKSIV